MSEPATTELPRPAAAAGVARDNTDLPVTVNRPQPGWMPFDVPELWRARELLWTLGWREIQLRYKQTFLGAAWAVLQPTLTMAVFVLFLGHFTRPPTGGIPYALFVYAGLLPWLLFATGLTNAANSVIGSEGVITKVYFPRLLLPFAGLAPAIVDFLVSSVILFVLVLAWGVRPGWELLLAPLAVAVAVLAAAGLGSLVAALNVVYRDFRYIVPFFVQLGLFATPSIYVDLGAADRPAQNQVEDSRPADAGRADTRGALVSQLAYLNPMTAVVETFRAGVVGRPDQVPWKAFSISAAISAVLFLFGCWYFRRVESEFADAI